MECRIHRTDSTNPDFLGLVSQLDGLLAELNGENHSFYSSLNQVGVIPSVVIAYSGDDPVGCGAFREYDEKSVEIKRMFVVANQRGKGIGRAVLAELENWAMELGYTDAVLETSPRLSSAYSLYLKSGFELIPNYEPYVCAGDSTCMRKPLSPAA